MWPASHAHCTNFVRSIRYHTSLGDTEYSGIIFRCCELSFPFDISWYGEAYFARKGEKKDETCVQYYFQLCVSRNGSNLKATTTTQGKSPSLINSLESRRDKPNLDLSLLYHSKKNQFVLDSRYLVYKVSCHHT